LIEQGHDVVAIDNLCNNDSSALERVASYTGVSFKFFDADARNGYELMSILEDCPVDALIHLAGLTSVPDSFVQPVEYYENNVGGALTLLRVMALNGIKRIVFSSSAAVYGAQPIQPVTEETALLPAQSPYARTKAIVEGLLADAAYADPDMRVVVLRYFNPVGAHTTASIGQKPLSKSGNLMSAILEVASGAESFVPVFGDDYPTADGTAERDYLHICDLAEGHVAALSALNTPGVHTYNLGAGRPVSVFEMIRAFSDATGMSVPYRVCERRAGDLPQSWADVSKSKAALGWTASRSLAQMCVDAWTFYRTVGVEGV